MNDVLRTAIMRIMSEMLDEPDEHGIYPTSRFMDRIEALLVSMMAAPEVMHLSGSEALYGFMAWLTTNGDNYRIGPKEDCAVWPTLIEEFCKTNHLHEPREQWAELLTHPVKKAA